MLTTYSWSSHLLRRQCFIEPNWNLYIVLIFVILCPQKNKNIEARGRGGEDTSPSAPHWEINRWRRSRLSGFCTNKSPWTLAAQHNRSAGISAEPGRKSTATAASVQVDPAHYPICIRRHFQRQGLEPTTLQVCLLLCVVGESRSAVSDCLVHRFLPSRNWHPSSKMFASRLLTATENKPQNQRHRVGGLMQSIYFPSHLSIINPSCLGAATRLHPGPVSALWMGHTERRSTCLALCSQPPARSGHLDLGGGHVCCSLT